MGENKNWTFSRNLLTGGNWLNLCLALLMLSCLGKYLERW